MWDTRLKDSGVMDFTGLMKFRMEIHNTETSQELMNYVAYCPFYEACRIMADAVIRELGEGDGENGGMGDLRNCWGDIFNAFMFHHRYEYADVMFVIYGIE